MSGTDYAVLLTLLALEVFAVWRVIAGRRSMRASIRSLDASRLFAGMADAFAIISAKARIELRHHDRPKPQSRKPAHRHPTALARRAMQRARGAA